MNKLSIQEYKDYWKNTHQGCVDDLAAVIFPDKPNWFNRFFDRVEKFAITRWTKGERMQGKKILDLGCSRGRWLDYFSQFRGGVVQGVDLSQKAVHICTKKGYKTYQGSIDDLSFLEDNYFDYITSITVLLHLPYDIKERAIEQIGLKLKENGKAILIESTWDDPAPHVFSLSNEEWITLFKKYGMKMIYEEGHLWNFARRSCFFQAKWMERLAIGIDYILDYILMFLMKGKRGKRCMQHLMVFEKITNAEEEDGKEKFKKISAIETKTIKYYKGIRIKADWGMHEKIADLCIKYLQKNAAILDYGCGEGALSQRLYDIGKSNGWDITSVDINKKDFKASTNFIQLDFNDENAVERFLKENKEKYDLVLGIEVIEHLENPWKYIRSLKQLSKKGGYIIVSTPNITSWYSRVMFFFSGRFHQFGDGDRQYGHINPIASDELSYIVEKCDMQIVKMEEGGYLPRLWISKYPRTMIKNIFGFIWSFAMKGLFRGWCIIAVIRNKRKRERH